jgi:hypothetical protein
VAVLQATTVVEVVDRAGTWQRVFYGHFGIEETEYTQLVAVE